MHYDRKPLQEEVHEPVSGHGDEYGYDEWHVHADVPFLSVCQKLNAVSFVWIVEN